MVFDYSTEQKCAPDVHKHPEISLERRVLLKDQRLRVRSKDKTLFILAGNLKLFTARTQYQPTVHVAPRSWAFGSRVSYKVLMSSSKFFLPPQTSTRKARLRCSGLTFRTLAVPNAHLGRRRARNYQFGGALVHQASVKRLNVALCAPLALGNSRRRKKTRIKRLQRSWRRHFCGGMKPSRPVRGAANPISVITAFFINEAGDKVTFVPSLGRRSHHF